MSLPEVPSYPEFTALVSLHSTSPSGTIPERNAQAFSILEVADQAMKTARKEWEAVSKVSAETARCESCEEWWRAGVKNVLRSCIGANIAIAAAKKAVAKAGKFSGAEKLNVEIGGSGKSYHSWWIVPKIEAR